MKAISNSSLNSYFMGTPCSSTMLSEQLKRNWVSATNSKFQNPISLQSDSVQRLFDLTKFKVKLSKVYEIGLQKKGIKSLEFVAKSQFLC